MRIRSKPARAEQPLHLIFAEPEPRDHLLAIFLAIVGQHVRDHQPRRASASDGLPTRG
jgi:hypothetical protein